MMENNEVCEKTGKKCKCREDFKTFCIALLTSIIVLALYHFGMGVYAIFCGTANYSSMPVTRQYMLVPIMALPQQGPGMHGGPGQEGGPRMHFRRGGRRDGMPRGPEMKAHGPGEEAPKAAAENALPPPPPAPAK